MSQIAGVREMNPSEAKMYQSDLNWNERAQRVFPGGALGAFTLPAGEEFVIARGEGAHLYDTDGHRYIDCVLGSGPMILGHAHPAIVSAVRAQLERGSQFYTVNDAAIRLAETILAATGWAERLKFTSTGSEATYFALRLARAATGRDKILKFEGAYHGHHDYVMMSTTPSAPAEFPKALPDSAGIPRALESEVLIAPFNDLDQAVRLVDAHHDQLAAVIIEPGCRLIEPRPGFLQGLREATRRHGIVLVFDEVVTGFRVAYGGSRALYHVTPDLICFGKIIGGGYPLAAVAGTRDLLEFANPRKRGPRYAYVSGTLNGNPLAATAGLATLEELRRAGVYEQLNAAGTRLRRALADVCRELRIPAQILGIASMLNVYFTATPIHDYRTARTEDLARKDKLNRELLRRGLIANLSAKLYLSTAHTDEVLDETIAIFADALQSVSHE
jgi:glutamate-1-semialdehyde 2,1-aminomutase